MEYDIFVGKDEQPVTLMQKQNEEGTNFMTWSSRLALKSHGRHQYNAHRKRQDDTETTLTTVLTQAGVPIYGDGISITLFVNGFLPDQRRFGFEFHGG